MLRNKIQGEDISEIRDEKKYLLRRIQQYPWCCHQEQKSRIIQHVGVTDGRIYIKESFIDFIRAHEKTVVDWHY
jgi:hypothetical protein